MEPFALKMVEDPHIHNQLICKIYGIFNWIGFSPINQNPAGLLHQILEDLLAMILIICGSFFFIVFPLYDTQIATSVFSTLYYSNQDMD
ncbi:hypothetical protein E1A91_D11G205500v1 [Gossypium mustelinum]|uniref:Uncharacterized protein n=1 Tax=Gossypium mustelinum TaxID=34275 RepID=A0A5D2STW9_GOSMU|nr:hypothetical protein E1A91_D11G205500v1 [Gossypium mustelinum]